MYRQILTNPILVTLIAVGYPLGFTGLLLIYVRFEILHNVVTLAAIAIIAGTWWLLRSRTSEYFFTTVFAVIVFLALLDFHLVYRYDYPFSRIGDEIFYLLIDTNTIEINRVFASLWAGRDRRLPDVNSAICHLV